LSKPIEIKESKEAPKDFKNQEHKYPEKRFKDSKEVNSEKTQTKNTGR
jgi:hypothetical protein